MLKMTDVKLEKISDIDKYLFIEKGLRGGISYIAKRYAKANNKYMYDYDPKTVNICIIPWHEEFIWLGNEWVSSLWGVQMVNSDKFDVISISKKSLIGYFLEVDLEYSDELHELHN